MLPVRAERKKFFDRKKRRIKNQSAVKAEKRYCYGKLHIELLLHGRFDQGTF